MSSIELEARMLKSSAWLSIQAELRIAKILTELKWSVVHGSFFTDPGTNKLREIDVIGRRSWKRKRKGLDAHACLHLVLECKSALGYHVLISSISEPESIPHQVWIGQEKTYELQIISTLRQEGLTEKQISKVMTKFKKSAYPGGGMRQGYMIIDPPPSAYHAGAFREHNIGNEKDLDASVVWKAHLALASALRALEIEQIEHVFGDLPIEIECARQFGEDLVQTATDHLFVFLNFVYLYHPVVVIDAPLWVIEGDKPKEIEWCRFHRLSSSGHSDWWFDLVCSANFESYACNLTDHYSKAFRHAGSTID